MTSGRERRRVDLEQSGSLFGALNTLQQEMRETFLSTYARDDRPAGGDAQLRRDRCLGSTELRGASNEVIVIVHHDELLAPPSGLAKGWGNTVAFQICRAKVSGVRAADWERRVLAAIVGVLSPWYATCHTYDEHWAKNMDTTEGLRAIGKDISRALPGVYWQNFFGPAYCREIGEERLLSTPRAKARRLGNGVAVELSDDPRDWESDEYSANEAVAIRHIGEQWFFQRHRGYEGTRPLPLPE